MLIRNLQCGGKNCYGQSEAKRIARAVMKARNRDIRVYQCRECWYYHLTSEAEKDKSWKN